MDTISNIRRLIYRAKTDHIFTTREFLAFGLRAAVDQALYRLVKRGLLVRVARGVFIKENAQMPSAEKVAERKSEAFGKTIRTHCADLAKELKLLAEGNPEPTFATSGQSSSFCFGNKRIHFKGIGPRRIKLGDSTAGKALRALWHIGQRFCLPSATTDATRHFNRLDRQEIKQAAAFMPAWLTNNLCPRWC